MENFVKKFFATYTAIRYIYFEPIVIILINLINELGAEMAYLHYRMKMVGGDCIWRDTASCFVQPLTTFVCVFLEKGVMAVKTMLVQEGVNGSVIVVE